MAQFQSPDMRWNPCTITRTQHNSYNSQWKYWGSFAYRVHELQSLSSRTLCSFWPQPKVQMSRPVCQPVGHALKSRSPEPVLRTKGWISSVQTHSASFSFHLPRGHSSLPCEELWQMRQLCPLPFHSMEKVNNWIIQAALLHTCLEINSLGFTFPVYVKFCLKLAKKVVSSLNFLHHFEDPVFELDATVRETSLSISLFNLD